MSIKSALLPLLLTTLVLTACQAGETRPPHRRRPLR